MKEVTIYSTPTCVYCKMAKDFFAKNSIAYDEHDVAADTAARKVMFDKTHQMGVPVITLPGRTFAGGAEAVQFGAGQGTVDLGVDAHVESWRLLGLA